MNPNPILILTLTITKSLTLHVSKRRHLEAKHPLQRLHPRLRMKRLHMQKFHRIFSHRPKYPPHFTTGFHVGPSPWEGCGSALARSCSNVRWPVGRGHSSYLLLRGSVDAGSTYPCAGPYGRGQTPHLPMRWSFRTRANTNSHSHSATLTSLSLSFSPWPMALSRLRSVNLLAHATEPPHRRGREAPSLLTAETCRPAG